MICFCTIIGAAFLLRRQEESLALQLHTPQRLTRWFATHRLHKHAAFLQHRLINAVVRRRRPAAQPEYEARSTYVLASFCLLSFTASCGCPNTCSGIPSGICEFLRRTVEPFWKNRVWAEDEETSTTTGSRHWNGEIPRAKYMDGHRRPGAAPHT